MAYNVPPALRSGGIFITDVYKYTEKIERNSGMKRRNKITKPFQKITKPSHFLKPLLTAVD